MNRLYSIAVPLIVASTGAIPTIPTIPTLGPAGPMTSGIVALDDGTVFFVDSFSETVWRVQSGGQLHAFVTGRNGRTLCLDANGHLYGTHEDEAGRTLVWRADARGATDVSRTDVPEYGHAFVVEDNGDMIASSGSDRETGVRLVRAGEHDHELVAGGEMGFRDGTGAEARFMPIGGMTRTEEGDLLVTSGASIRRVRADGTVQTIAKGQRLLKPRQTFLARLFGDVHGHLTGIAAGSRGEIYVTNTTRAAVIRVAKDGTASEIMKSDRGWTPTGVAVANGIVYVLEYGHGVRVRRIDASGRLSTIAQVRPDRAVAATMPFGRLLPRMIG